DYFRPLPLDTLIHSIMQSLLGLDYLHHLKDSEGNPLDLVHRDICPGNILVSEQGVVKLIDFGLLHSNQNTNTTQPGTKKGTFAYMSPEQAAGSNVDARSDLFSLGLILYEGLTNQPLYERDDPLQTVKLAAEANIPLLHTVLPEIAPKLEEIVHKALAKDPDDRFQDALSFYDALGEYIAPFHGEWLRRSTMETIKAMETNENSLALGDISRRYTTYFHKKREIIYVLGDDPAFSNSVKNMLLARSTGGNEFEFHIIEEDFAVAQIIHKLDTREQIPHAVLFGMTHVHLQHDFLQRLSAYPEIAKIFVAEAPTKELLEEAMLLCGVNLLLHGMQRKKLLDFLKNSPITALKNRSQTLSISSNVEKQYSMESLTLQAPEFIKPLDLLRELDEDQDNEESDIPSPFSSDELLSPHESTQSKIVFFQGTLSELSMLDLLQLLDMSSKTAVIAISKITEKAYIYLEKGQVIDAKVGDLHGEEALETLLEWYDGDFLVHAPTSPMNKTIDQPTAPMLLDMLRKMDERNAQRSQELQLPDGEFL
ncbi:MAG TPA: hypothetical protein DCE42_04460, partial [Myxococcales bacterium]|nr:hypothetical protein [Myxococcales bacterium]